PDQSGDFSGAQVNLRTRSFPTNYVLRYSLGFGFNSAGLGSDVLHGPSTGLEWLGMAGGDRALPPELLDVQDFSRLPQADINQIVRSFGNAWTPQASRGLPNGSASVSLGGEDEMFGRRIGYIGALTYSRNQE